MDSETLEKWKNLIILIDNNKWQHVCQAMTKVDLCKKQMLTEIDSMLYWEWLLENYVWVLYGAETWTIIYRDVTYMESFEIWIRRKMQSTRDSKQWDGVGKDRGKSLLLIISLKERKADRMGDMLRHIRIVTHWKCNRRGDKRQKKKGWWKFWRFHWKGARRNEKERVG